MSYVAALLAVAVFLLVSELVEARRREQMLAADLDALRRHRADARRAWRTRPAPWATPPVQTAPVLALPAGRWPDPPPIETHARTQEIPAVHARRN